MTITLRGQWSSLYLVLTFCSSVAVVGCDHASRTWHEQRVGADTAAISGMDVYHVREPFVILVAKEFPKGDGSFQFMLPPSKLLLSVEDRKVDVKADHQRVMLILADDLCVYLDYNPTAAGEQRYANLTFVRDYPDRQDSLVDFNVDGEFDQKMIRERSQGQSTSRPHEVKFQGQWCVVGEHLEDPHQMELVTGEEVIFDMEMGIWRPRIRE